MAGCQSSGELFSLPTSVDYVGINDCGLDTALKEDCHRQLQDDCVTLLWDCYVATKSAQVCENVILC